MPSTFISYRRDDAAGYAGRLHDALERRLGRDEIFRDVDTLEPGQDFADAIDARIGACRVFIAMIGREWLDARDGSGRRRLDQPGDYVRKEIASALARREVRVIPVMIEGASMPDADSLPDDIRALTRKQALHLRDDAWDFDVDRLVTAITGDSTRKDAGIAHSSSRRWLVAGGIFVVAALALLIFSRIQSGTFSSGAPSADRTITSTDRSSPAGSSSAARGRSYGVPLPRLVEVAHTSLLYTILSASVTPLGNGANELRVRVRFSNNGRYDANAWDASFRLVVGSETLAPTSGLNEIAHGHSMTQGIVTFRVPAGTSKATLRVIDGDRVGELPLDLSATNRPADDEHADAGDALSHAVVTTVSATPRLLVRDGDHSVTIERATIRRFVNVVRLRLAVRFANNGRYPSASGDAVLRLAAGDQVLAPIESPSIVNDSKATAAADVEFEAPPETTRAVLRGTIGDTSGEWPLELQ